MILDWATADLDAVAQFLFRILETIFYTRGEAESVEYCICGMRKEESCTMKTHFSPFGYARNLFM